MIQIKVISTSLFIMVGVLFSGCGAKGPQFTEFKKPQENNGIVYVYRPSHFVGGGIDYDIYVNNSTMHNFMVGELVNGSYTAIPLPIGESKIRINLQQSLFFGITGKSSNTAIFDIKNGEIYCIKKGERLNLEIVDMVTCKSEIADTKRAVTESSE
jgi:hypothetical protein